MNPTYTELPMVSVVTINYNSAAVTCELLASLEKVTYPALEIIVIDNASKESPDEIKEKYPHVTLIKTHVNMGFAGGNNIGFKAAKGKYIMMLNNDTEVDPDFLQPLVEKMESDPSVGAVSSKLIYFNTDIIQYAGCSEISPMTGRSKFIGYKEKDNGKYDDAAPTHYAHGAAMMISRKLLENIGLMAELYFLYYEELDFCERIKRAGYSIWFIGKSVVYHKESMSIGKENPLKTYYMTRNRLLFMRRNIKGSLLWFNLVFFTLISVPKNILMFAVKKRFDLARAFYRGWVWNLFNKKIYENAEI